MAEIEILVNKAFFLQLEFGKTVCILLWVFRVIPDLAQGKKKFREDLCETVMGPGILKNFFQGMWPCAFSLLPPFTSVIPTLYYTIRFLFFHLPNSKVFLLWFLGVRVRGILFQISSLSTHTIAGNFFHLLDPCPAKEFHLCCQSLITQCPKCEFHQVYYYD